MTRIEITGKIDFISAIDGKRDCILSQQHASEDPGALWFNIDLPKGHGFRPGDRVKVTIEKI
ncbi:MAG: hypothetical protein LUO97_04045 [Methanomicrobiales archaeon]|nr:hypothetical protein [Methanomicrobiales archaeon]MDD1668954.1 hypothetical protein [Methanomicrobiales archaeon]